MNGMPPASETTSGREATAKSARISDERMLCARAAYDPSQGSSLVPPESE